jgi:hypothetical protein
MAECKHHAGYDCGDLPLPHVLVPENKLPKPKRRKGNQWRVAQMLAIVLDEPGDNPSNPGDVRLEQARRLLSMWNDAQGSVVGMLAEVINLKQGNCVRCDVIPCNVCGRQTYDSLISLEAL